MLRVFRRNPQGPTIEALYGAIVAQARAPIFYRDLQVADTINGRLDLLMLHLALAFERLSQGPKQAQAAGQALFDRFCQDMDDHLREEGVSDLKVPKDMRRLAEAFFGRQRAYITALKAGDRDALRAALLRNVFAEKDTAGLGSEPDARIEALAAYVETAWQSLGQQNAAAIALGRIGWPSTTPVEQDR